MAILGKGPGLKKMSNSLSRADSAVIKIKRFERLGIDVKKLPKVIVKALIQDVRQALLNSLRRSGIKSRSGNLRLAVSTASVVFVNGRLRFSFPAGLTEKLYRYGSSLNYGAVRQPKGTSAADKLGGRARRTLKKAVLRGKKLTKRQKRRFDQGVKQVHDGKALIKKPIDLGAVKVIPPKPYFFLTKADEVKIREKFTEIFEFLIRKIINKKAA